jgi:hypothetical protein
MFGQIGGWIGDMHFRRHAGDADKAMRSGRHEFLRNFSHIANPIWKIGPLNRKIANLSLQ